MARDGDAGNAAMTCMNTQERISHILYHRENYMFASYADISALYVGSISGDWSSSLISVGISVKMRYNDPGIHRQDEERKDAPHDHDGGSRVQQADKGRVKA